MATKKTLTFEDISKAEDRSAVEVDIPEWGGVVKVRPLSMRAYLKAQDLAAGGVVDGEAASVFTLINGLVEPQITEEEARDLLDKSGTVVNRILEAIAQASGMGMADRKNGTSPSPAP